MKTDTNTTEETLLEIRGILRTLADDKGQNITSSKR